MNPFPVPKDWSWESLEDIPANGRPIIKAGPFGSALKKESYTESGFRVYGQEQVIGGDFSIGDYYIDEAKFEKLKSCEVKPDDILISLVGSFGKCIVVPTGIEPGIINPRLLRLSFHPKSLCPDYFVHWFRSPIAQQVLARTAHGGTMGVLNAGNLREFKIPLPPLSEQKRIAGILDKADSIRRKRQQAIGLTEQFLRSTFLDMFGDPVTNPKGWSVKTLPDLVTRATVGIVVKPADYYVPNGIPALRSLNVRPNRIEAKEFVYFTEKDNVETHAKTRVWENDVVLVRSGQPGTAAVIPKEYDGVNAIDILIVSPNLEKLSPHYLAFFFNTDAGKRLVLGESRGQIQKHLNLTSLKKVPFPLPPRNEQDVFDEILRKTNATTARLKLQYKSANNLFNSLVQRAFRGEL